MGKCGSVMSNTLEEREKQLTKTVEIWSQKSEKKREKVLQDDEGICFVEFSAEDISKKMKKTKQTKKKQMKIK